jgi:hypothetical protein
VIKRDTNRQLLISEQQIPQLDEKISPVKGSCHQVRLSLWERDAVELRPKTAYHFAQVTHLIRFALSAKCRPT